MDQLVSSFDQEILIRSHSPGQAFVIALFA
jgi:hypothetical protein